MRKFIGRLLVVIAFGWAGSASAMPMSITDTVAVDGREWAQPDDFTSLSWNAIFNVCGTGTCSGTLTSDSGTWDMDGWSWADVDAVNGLFNSYLSEAGVTGINLLDGPDYHTEEGSTWAAAFFADFVALGIPSICTQCIFATTSELASGISPYVGSVAIDSIYWGGQDIIAMDDGGFDIDIAYEWQGAWFYRQANSVTSVPISSTVYLLGLGLLGLRMTRQRAR